MSSIGHLTGRQVEVVALLAEGLRYAEVATQLSISTRQVQRHTAQAVERAGVLNVCQLVASAIHQRLI
jgi:DNA-binding CsgD family transcriptional regulator